MTKRGRFGPAMPIGAGFMADRVLAETLA